MPISRSQMERQLRMRGGIMEVAPRQGALLGGLKKAVKGVAKGIGSFLKSDLGKAALLGVGAFGLPKIGTFFQGMPGLLSGKLPELGIKELLTKKAADKTFGDTLKVGAMGTVLGGVLSALDPQEEEEITSGRNLGALRSKLTQAYQNLGYSQNEIPSLVENDMSEYTSGGGAYATGGRVGYKNGSDKVKSDIFGIGDPEKVSKVGGKIVGKFEGLGSLITDKEGNVYLPIQMLRKLGEDIFFGGQKNPKLSEKFYNKLDDKYIEEMKKVKERKYAQGGRIGYADGTEKIIPKKKPVRFMTEEELEEYYPGLARGEIYNYEEKKAAARKNKAIGGDVVDQASGIMGLPQRTNAAGVKELDLRESGGFIPPVGVKEKADDIPAMLSNNEFVFTADAVRGMGGGNVNLGAQRLYDQMKKLEKGGRV